MLINQASRLFLQLNRLHNSFLQVRDQIFLAQTKRDLIRNLIEVTGGPAVLTEITSDGETELLQVRDQIADLSAFGDRRQVHHNRCSQTCTCIGRTGR